MGSGIGSLDTVLHTVRDLPIGYIDLSLGPQDPREPPTNCGTH